MPSAIVKKSDMDAQPSATDTMTIRILMLEDDPVDAQFIQKVIARAAMPCQIMVTSDREGFTRALREHRHDVILSDHQLPQFNSVEALALSRQYAADTPFILVTGSVSEEFAVSIIKAGADDYLLKSNLHRLPTAVLNAIESRNKSKEIGTLNRSLDYFQRAIYSAAIVSRTDGEGRITFVNDNFVEVSGFTRDELMGMNHRIVNSGYHSREFWHDLWRTVKAGKTWTGDVRNRRKDGSIFWTTTTIIPFVGDGQMVSEYLAIRYDITERKAAEEKVEEYRRFIDLANDLVMIGHWTHDLSTDKIELSEGARKILGMNVGVEIKPQDLVRFLPASDRDMVIRLHRESVLNGKGYKLDHRIDLPGVGIRWVHKEQHVVLDDRGKPHVLFGVVQDITERKLTEEKLLEYQSRLDKANEMARIGHWTLDLRTENVELTKSARELLKLNEPGLRGLTSFYPLVNPQDLPMMQNLLRKSIAEGTPYELDLRLNIEGTEKWVHAEARIVRDEYNAPSLMLGIIQDVTERKQAEVAIRRSNERYELVANATNDVFWDKDFQANTVIRSPKIVSVFGLTEEEVEETTEWWASRVHPDDRDEAVNSLNGVMAAGVTYWETKYRFRCGDGTYKNVYDVGYFIYDQGGKPLRAIGAMRDVTEQEHALADVRRLSLVASHADNGVLISNERGIIEYVNDSFLRHLGYTREEVLGKSHDYFFRGAGQDDAQLKRILSQLNSNASVSEEIACFRKGGDTVWFKASIIPVVDQRGKKQSWVSVCTDITANKEYEVKITAIARELTDLVEHANVPIFGLDRNGYFNDWNKASVRLTGYRKNDMLGKKWSLWVPNEIQLSFLEKFSRVLVGESISNFELLVNTQSGQPLTLLISMSPRYGFDGDLIGAICVGQDFTEVLQYRVDLESIVEERTRELNEALAAEKELVELKSKFVSIASHEFRTPLSTILLSADFLKKYREKATTDDYQRKLEVIEKQVTHMTRLLDDVLVVGKADAGRIKVTPENVPVRTMLEEMAQGAESLEHRVLFVWKGMDETFVTDEKLLRNIVNNLLSNAVKFSPALKPVEMKVSHGPRGLEIRVKDAGIGIPVEDQKHLFESFFRASNAISVQGTGLGLSIVRKAVGLLHGRITFSSKPGEGTEFRVFLPDWKLVKPDVEQA